MLLAVKSIKLGAFLFVALMASGCATIVSGTNQKINVTSMPSDAVAKVDNNLTAKTPATFTLERKSDHTIEISKDGFKTAIVMIRRSVNGMAFGNALVGGIIGVGVDMASGANQKLIPERVNVVLEEGSGYSDTPKFVSAQDQEFYEKNVLNTKKTTMDSAPTSDNASAKFTSATQADVAPRSVATTNFGPRKN